MSCDVSRPRIERGVHVMQKSAMTVCLIALLTTVCAFCADNSIGTWKLNAEKSKSSLGPLPVKSLTSVREASDGGVKVTVTGERADGTKIDTVYTGRYDGKENNVTGTGLLYDKIAIKQVNA